MAAATEVETTPNQDRLQTWRYLAPAADLSDSVVTLIDGSIQGCRDHTYRRFPEGLAYLFATGLAAGGTPRLYFARWTSMSTPIPFGADTCGIIMHSHEVAHIAGSNAAEVPNGRNELTRFWGHSADEMLGRMAEAGCVTEQRRVLQDACRQQLERNRRKDSSAMVLVRAAVRMAYGHQGSLRVEELALQLGITRRHLMRVFVQVFGTSPKCFLDLLRLRRTVGLLQQRAMQRCDLDMLACDLEYADQAHMTRSFSSVLGMTPGKLLSSLRNKRAWIAHGLLIEGKSSTL